MTKPDTLVHKLKTGLKLFSIFFYVGVFTIGGGYAMIPAIKRIIVEREKYLTEDEFLEMFAISQITPGPIAVNMATFIGYRECGIIGSALATIGVVLPSLIIITIISIFFLNFTKYTAVQKFFVGILAGVVGEIGYLTFDLARKIKINLFNIGVFVLSLFTLFVIKVNPIYVIIIGGTIGIVVNGLLREHGTH
jgi:chromate transporter